MQMLYSLGEVRLLKWYVSYQKTHNYEIVGLIPGKVIIG